MILNAEVMESLSSNLIDEIENYSETTNTFEAGYDAMQSNKIDFLQIHLKCCGIDSYQDWIRNQELAASQSVPDSCCKVLSTNCGFGIMSSFTQNITTSEAELDKVIYVSGCIDQSQDLFQRNGLIIGLILIGIFGIQIITIILSWCLSEQMSERRRWRNKYNKKPFQKRNYY